MTSSEQGSPYASSQQRDRPDDQAMATAARPEPGFDLDIREVEVPYTGNAFRLFFDEP